MACSTTYPMLFVLLIFPLHIFAQTKFTIPLGSSLTANQETTPWLSQSGDFAFGFKQIQPQNQFFLCIYYAKIKDTTIIWYANDGYPVPRGSIAELNPQNGLILRDPQGKMIWSTSPIIASNVAYAVMNNTGNFVLVGSESSVLWESFRYPTDTLLPTQILEIDDKLVSRKSESLSVPGRFYLRMLSNGNLVLVTQSRPTNFDYDAGYYNSHTSDPGDEANSGYRLIFDELGSVYILKRNNHRLLLTPPNVPSISENYHRLSLDFDGVLTHYYHPKSTTSTGNERWSTLWSLPDNICLAILGETGSGVCGYNNVCHLGENQRPYCVCPKGYSLTDPNNKYGNCKPKFIPSCDEFGKGNPEDLYDFDVVTDVDWPLSDFERIYPSAEEECRKACLEDCFCAVAIYRSNSCWKKKLPLSNGRVDATLNVKAFLKIRKVST
ncbi:G-type lectin S-receptor-like serine/threonine-protein kinase LECRK2 [Lycium barbarum]|uniref:G-type lectin S-receptor-like serine/threonine-protein kinase LECRK2 n=1 Tax=Lycium barbarum TaxID=112863 RepID=UPI00293E2607|nr:G-type lectin S-receptor-like serine/threonine-protein kinase LECRK2 [Lycium barbarum]